MRKNIVAGNWKMNKTLPQAIELINEIKNNKPNNNAEVIGVPLKQWVQDDPENFNDMQMAELQIFKFQTVEQVATATDNQLQRIGMGAVGLREMARRYLQVKNQSSSQTEIEHTKSELAEVKEQLAALVAQMSEKKVGRPRKEE